MLYSSINICLIRIATRSIDAAFILATRKFKERTHLIYGLNVYLYTHNTGVAYISVLFKRKRAHRVFWPLIRKSYYPARCKRDHRHRAASVHNKSIRTVFFCTLFSRVLCACTPCARIS